MSKFSLRSPAFADATGTQRIASTAVFPKTKLL